MTERYDRPELVDAISKACRPKMLLRSSAFKRDHHQGAIALAKSRFYHDAADAPATVRAYASDVARLKAWCDQASLVALPAEPEVVGAYVAAAWAEYAYSTLRRRGAAIARASALAGAPLDTKHHAIRETLRGIGRTLDERGRRATALTTADLGSLMSECCKDICGEPAVRLTGLGDRALLLLAFAGAFRRSELVAIDVAHITWSQDGFTVLVTKSKHGGPGKGAEITIAAGRRRAS